jgi:hypothetical protein
MADYRPLNRAERLSLQSQWLNHRMADSPAWKAAAPQPRLLSVSENKAFVAWLPGADGQPQVIDLLRATDIQISFTTGITVTLTGRASSNGYHISTHPREILPGVFAWVPPFCEVRFCPYQFSDPASVWRTTLPIIVRIPGQIVFSTLKEFRDQWPGVNV